MKETVTIEKGTYNALLGCKIKLQEQTQAFIKLKADYRALEIKYFTLLTTNNQARDIVSLGDYNEQIT